jgi:hypothetical protein
MRVPCAIGLMSLGLSVVAAAQDNAPKPRVSKSPLTSEQVAVYRAVLEDYTKGNDGALNLANRTEPLEEPGPFFDKGCVKGLALENNAQSVPVVHQLDRAVALNEKMVLVDPDRQEKKIEENDPQKLVNRAIDDGERVTEKQLDSSVRQAFATGLFTLSEIVFDKQHRHAVLAYSFVCGGLCGHGKTLALKKVGQKWRITKRCGGWIS